MSYIQHLRNAAFAVAITTLTACGGGSTGGGTGGGTGGSQNQAPTASAGSNATVDEQTTVTLSGSGTDSDGSIVSYSWSQSSGSSVELSSPSSATTEFSAPTLTAVEQLTFTLTVTDNDGATASDDITITVNPVNLAPIAQAGDNMTVDEQTLVTLTGQGSDEDGSVQTYSWVQTAGSEVVLSDATTATTTFTAPTITNSEQLTFALTVTDNEGLSATDELTVTINPINLAPTVNAGNDSSVDEQTTVTLSGSANDTDGSIASVSWEQTQGTTVTLADSTAVTTTFTAPMVSENQTLSFTLTATDNEGASSTDTVDIQVAPAHNFVLVDSQQQANEYAPATPLQWSVENYDAENHTLTWEVITTAPLEYNMGGTSFVHPETIDFISLLVAEDTPVTINVTLNDGTNEYNLSKTIIMLAQGSVRFAAEKRSTSAIAAYIQTVTNPKVLDITGDGYTDVITKDKLAIGSASGELHIQDFSSNISAADFSITDINNDGLQDILFNNNSQISWSLNSNDETPFSQFRTIDLPTNAAYTQTVSGDFDGDNDTDIAVVYEIDGQTTPKLAWYEQDNGEYKAMAMIDVEVNSWDSPSGHPKMVTGNFQDNGKTDILIATSSTNDSRPNILYAHTDNGFDKSTAYYLSGSNMYATYYTRDIQTIDINQDGFDDILTWQSGYFFNNDDAKSYYLINNKDGTFTRDLLHFAYNTNFRFSVLDIDGDGDSDIIHGNDAGDFFADIGSNYQSSYTGQVIWYENLGESISKKQKVLVNSTKASQMNIGDFDSDGDIDLIVSASDSGSWYSENKRNEIEAQNQRPTASAGDNIAVNGDELVTLNGSGTDPDGSIASYSWVQSGGRLVTLTDTTNKDLSFTSLPVASYTRQLLFELTVTDNEGLSHTDSVRVTVNAANRSGAKI